jgi:hypothetical protein
VGLRIVAMSTRVRLLIYPCSVPAGDRAHVTGCEGKELSMDEVDDADLVVERISALDPGTRAAVIGRLTADAVQQVKDRVDR